MRVITFQGVMGRNPFSIYSWSDKIEGKYCGCFHRIQFRSSTGYVYTKAIEEYSINIQW